MTLGHSKHIFILHVEVTEYWKMICDLELKENTVEVSNKLKRGKTCTFGKTAVENVEAMHWKGAHEQVSTCGELEALLHVTDMHVTEVS